MNPFVGEIRIVPFNFAPTGWALCNGQIMSIAQNTALFSLLGTNYGGNGTSNFALPDFQARVPIDYGNGPGLSPYSIGQNGGETTVTLTSGQLGAHTHPLMGTASTATALAPNSNVVFGTPPGTGRNPSRLYKSGTVTTPITLDPSLIGATGSGQAHNNQQPYLVLNFIIALQGIFPPRA